MSDQTPGNVAFDPRSPRLREDPVAFWEGLRAKGALYPNGNGTWVATSYRACSELLRDSQNVAKATAQRLANMPRGRFYDYNVNTMAFMDGPEHRKVRGAVFPAFGPGNIRRMTETVEALCGEFMADLKGRPGFDFMRDFATPFPLYVICDILGIPRDHRETFGEGAHAVVAGLEPMAPPELIARADAACDALGAIVTRYARERPADPDGDLISFLKAQHEAGLIDWDQYVNHMIFLLVAGHETTSTMLSQGMNYLLRHPEQAAALRADPSRAMTAVNEILRLHPPLQFVLRQTLAPVTVEGVELPAGQLIFVLVGAANRDPEMFPDPDTLDLARTNAASHLAFIAGPHTCLGSNLARLEGRMVFERILREMPDLMLDGPPAPNQNFLFQGFSAMPVRQSAPHPV
ncbi:MAG: cytochrome P450 [Rhodobacter sp.]|nr:cytochrome P450 [Paracoccaceae bacterium]MCC0077335.1 cytochrome P450 [Rhodobacter sp.]